MDTDFVLRVKCIIFWLNTGLKVNFDLYVPDFPKSTSKYFFFYILVLFSPEHPILEAFLIIKTPKTCKKHILAKKMENFVKNTFVIWVWKKLHDWAPQNNYLNKTLHPRMIHCCEAPRSMLSNYFYKKQILRGTIGEIWRKQIQMYPKMILS